MKPRARIEGRVWIGDCLSQGTAREVVIVLNEINEDSESQHNGVDERAEYIPATENGPSSDSFGVEYDCNLDVCYSDHHAPAIHQYLLEMAMQPAAANEKVLLKYRLTSKLQRLYGTGKLSKSIDIDSSDLSTPNIYPNQNLKALYVVRRSPAEKARITSEATQFYKCYIDTTIYPSSHSSLPGITRGTGYDLLRPSSPLHRY
ncbi:hypothetical protein BDP27DRAFT_1367756 [Rhodocollybia butyracea]|uniref:Uncharacterized protein n=1 Tax=Rhodocollybia butyracea TaxID=206335 RepID=A0A9P5U2P4_9AGAR|nr:hypothetical protein BDP27DRAFT_1367756 [Rhodocollybia butyracea]